MPAKKHRTYRRNYGRGHGYLIDGARAIGVTTALGKAINKPGLVKWAARSVAEAAVDELDIWRPIAQGKGRDRAVEYLKESPYADRDQAAKKGSEIHELAEKLALGEEVDVDELTGPFVDRYLEWRTGFNVEDVEVELIVVSRTHGYAGTCDLVADIDWPASTVGPAGRYRTIIDYKTGKDIYDETALQIAAYRYADVYLEDPAGGVEHDVADLGIERAAALLLHADEAILYPLDAGEETFRTFLYCLQVAAFVEAGDKAFKSREPFVKLDPIYPPNETN